MWILRYVILASRNRGNANLDRRTRMTFDPLHGAAMHVCKDKPEWDQRGEQQVAVLENELRMDIEAFNTETGERRKIDQTLEVRPVSPFSSSQGASEALVSHTHEEVSSTLTPETISTPPTADPEPGADEEPTGTASVSSGEEAQAESEPDAVPTSLPEPVQPPPAPKPKRGRPAKK